MLSQNSLTTRCHAFISNTFYSLDCDFRKMFHYGRNTAVMVAFEKCVKNVLNDVADFVANEKNGICEVVLFCVKVLIMKEKEWSRLSDSNRRPADYKSTALPTELSRHKKRSNNIDYFSGKSTL